jgi:hypothetical protein
MNSSHILPGIEWKTNTSSHDLIRLIMHRALAVMIHEPFPDAMQMKTTETFQTTHILTNLKLLQAYRAFGIVNAILLCGFVREHPGWAECWGR